MMQLKDKLKGARQLPLLALVMCLGVAALLWVNASGGAQHEQSGTTLEARMASVLGAIEGAGHVRVLLRERDVAPAMATAQDMQLVDGAVVVAEGAGDLRVALSLQRAVKALLGVPLERIEVLVMDGRGG